MKSKIRSCAFFQKSIIVLCVIASFFSVASCSKDYRTAALYGGVTVEQNANKMAGVNGSVDYYRPKEKYSNANYAAFGARVQNPDYGKCDFVYCVDTVSNAVERIEYAVFNGVKIKAYDGVYLVADDDNAYSLLKWQSVVLGVDISDYSVRAPVPIPVDDYYKSTAVSYDWYSDFDLIQTKTADGVTVSLGLALGYKYDDEVTATEIENHKIEIVAYLRYFTAGKAVADFVPQNENVLRLEIKRSINDDVLTVGRVHDVRFTCLDVGKVD